MGKIDLRTVIAPSGYARSSNFRISSVIKGLIGRSLDVFWRKRGMTSLKYLSIQSSLRGDNRGQAIFELGKNKLIRSPLEFFALQKIGVTICYILISSVGMATMAKAECVPYPDCASIGYTETSCETQAVKCPFDGSKLYCLPCDSKYQYTCNGVGEAGEGVGCQGKYETCGCQSGYNYFCGINFCKLNYC